MASKQEVEDAVRNYEQDWAKKDWWAKNCMTGFPIAPTDGNDIIPLIDGESYGKQLLSEIGKAKKYVFITDWLLDSDFALERPGTAANSDKKRWAPSTVSVLVAELARRKVPVRVVLWDRLGSLEVIKQKAILEQVGAGYCLVALSGALQGCNKVLGDIHQKTVVIDGNVAFCGGIDLAYREESDRWDTSKHCSKDARRQGQQAENWHDIQVQVKGPAVKWIQENFRRRWAVAVGKDVDVKLEWPGTRQGSLRAQVVRTIPEQGWMKYGQPADTEEYSIVESYGRAIINARNLIYIENQYFTSKFLFDLLQRRLTAMPSLHLIVLLPKRDEMGVAMNGSEPSLFMDGIPPLLAAAALQKIAPARVFFGRRVNDKGEPIYVHAKIMIVDDVYAVIGSSNFSDRSMLNQDQELDIAWVDEKGTSVSGFRKKLWAEHFGVSAERPSLAGKPAELVQLWRSCNGLVRKWE